MRRWIIAFLLCTSLALVGCGGGTGISHSANAAGTDSSASSTLSATPAAVAFGVVNVGETQTLPVTLTNSSSIGAPISISALSLSGNGFKILPVSLPVILSAGASITVTLNFTPTSASSFAGVLTVTSNAANPSVSIGLSGSGQAGSLALGVSPSSLDFGNVQVGGTQVGTVVLSNGSAQGGASIQISQLAISGAGFSISPSISLPVSIAPLQSLTVGMIFAPTSGGPASGTLSVFSSASNSPLVVALTGTGLAPGQLGVSPASLNFGKVVVGSSGTLGGTLTAGSSAITVNSASLTNPAFTLSGINLPLTIYAGQSASFSVTFTPASAGQAAGSISFSSNASNSPSVATLAATGVLQGGGGPPPGAISSGFFGMDIANLSSPWPTQLGAKFSFWRSLGAQVRWSNLEPNCDGGIDPTNPCYQWGVFDQWASAAAANGQDILFTAYYTPVWASSNPTATCQYVPGNPQSPTPGGCYPPSDVASGDNHWKNFLTALYKHTTTTPGLKPIKYFECWNEPDVPAEYSDNNPNNALADLNTMCSDLQSTMHALNANAKFTTPTPTLGPGAVKWLESWINAGYANYANYLGYHGYVCNNPLTCSPASAETELSAILTPLQAFIASTKGTANDVTGKLLWDTEGSDDVGGVALADPDQHAAFYARFTLLQQSAGVSKYSYWGYDFGGGNSLVDNPGYNNATLNEAGVAWQQIQNWTVGMAYQSPCANTNGTVWQCTLTDGTNTSLIVWDAAQTCIAGICTTSTFNVPAGYGTTTDLAGDSATVAGGTVQIGAKPILLQ